MSFLSLWCDIFENKTANVAALLRQVISPRNRKIVWFKVDWNRVIVRLKHSMKDTILYLIQVQSHLLPFLTKGFVLSHNSWMLWHSLFINNGRSAGGIVLLLIGRGTLQTAFCCSTTLATERWAASLSLQNTHTHTHLPLDSDTKHLSTTASRPVRQLYANRSCPQTIDYYSAQMVLQTLFDNDISQSARGSLADYVKKPLWVLCALSDMQHFNCLAYYIYFANALIFTHDPVRKTEDSIIITWHKVVSNCRH